MPFGGLGNLPGSIAGVVVGGALGIFLLVTIWILAAVLFKRTGNQGSGIFRIIWGAGGALFGLLIGLTVLWGGISIVRSLGTIAESRVETPDNRRPAQPAVAEGLLALKKSLELGSAGRFLTSVDVLPPDFYELFVQIGKLTSDEQAMRRFLEHPALQDILQNPRIVDLANDPGVIRACEEGNIFLFFDNEAVAAAIADPALAEQLKKVDLGAALKFALESSPPSPAPSQTQSPAKRK